MQSGNIILDSDESKTVIWQIIKEGITAKFNYDVPVLARTVSEWKKIIANYPFSTENTKIVAFTFLDKIASETEIDVKSINEDVYKIEKDIVYLYCPSGFGKTKITNNIIEKKLKVIATSRNYRTTMRLLELATK